jgi:tetratricopeptide (TPR) repeat protein
VTRLVFPDHQYALDWLDYEKYDDPIRLARLTMESTFMEQGSDAGLRKLEEARKQFPEFAKEDMLIETARYLGESGKQEEAIALLGACLESYPESLEARLGMGLACMEIGRNQDAIEILESALKIHKDHPLAARGLQWAKEALAAQRTPVMLSAAELGKLSGDYGPRHIVLRDGRLYYHRDGRPEYRLIAINRNTFALERYAQFRIEFARDENGQITKIVGYYIQGTWDESPRDH